MAKLGLEIAPDAINSTLTSVISEVDLDKLMVEWSGEFLAIADAPIITASRSVMGTLAGGSQLISLGQAATGLGLQTKSSLSNGRNIHSQYKLNDVDKLAGKFKEYGEIKGIRPDFVDISNKTVYELKPNNSQGIYRGKKQLKKYTEILSKKIGGKWKGVLDLY